MQIIERWITEALHDDLLKLRVTTFKTHWSIKAKTKVKGKSWDSTFHLTARGYIHKRDQAQIQQKNHLKFTAVYTKLGLFFCST